MGPSRDLPPAFGATLTRDGVDFAVYAGRADGVDICLFEPGDTTGDSERRVALGNRAHGTWFGSVPGRGTGCGRTARGSPTRACATTPTSCCWIPTPGRSRARWPGAQRCSAMLWMTA